jgi:glycosyltransferase involved in cell wall biosynthesis
VDAVIVQNSRMARSFASANVHIIPHEVDLEVFRPTERREARRVLGLSDTRQYLLFAANPAIPVKRFPLAQAAFDRLRALHPDLELLTVFKEPQPRLALYMSACDALVFPSYQEGSPNVVKQAMACSLPIVATDVGDVREIVGGTAGCHICSPDPEDFAVRLAEVLRHPSRTRGRERVEHLAGPIVARRLIALYEEVLQKRGKAWKTVESLG